LIPLTAQKPLSTEQVEAFHHDNFVEAQVRDFVALLGAAAREHGEVLDVGGGCGFFAQRLHALTGRRVRVMDTDAASIEAARRAGVEAIYGDALCPGETGSESVVTLNLILHHLVGRSERITADLQRQALTVWRSRVGALFVNEYIYESYLGNFSGWLIYQITKNSLLSLLGRAVATLVPSLRANTFGVGVRFRARGEWLHLFDAAGYVVESSTRGADEEISLPRRGLLIKRIRRDSFLLRPRGIQ
jgi:hypothetical protein